MNLLTTLRVEDRIQIIRRLRVMVDADLAALYGVQTKALNQAAKRNAGRFPSDFYFQLTTDEKAEVVTNCDHLQALKFSKTLPYAFTEHGAIQAANVLASAQAVEMGIYVVRAFVHLRQLLDAVRELMQPPEPPKRPIGFVALHDKSKTGKVSPKTKLGKTPVVKRSS